MIFTGCSNEQAEGIYGGVAPAPSVGAHSSAGRTFLSRGRGGSLAYGNGLSAIYTAESGANWALASLKQGPVENKEITISLDGREARVRISSVTKEGNTWKGKISSDGVDLQTKVMRFVKITFTVEDGGERKIMVESVESNR